MTPQYTHKEIVLGALSLTRPLSITQIVERTNLDVNECLSVLNQLRQEGEVEIGQFQCDDPLTPLTPFQWGWAPVPSDYNRSRGIVVEWDLRRPKLSDIPSYDTWHIG